jgi:hypothetical protein
MFRPLTTAGSAVIGAVVGAVTGAVIGPLALHLIGLQNCPSVIDCSVTGVYCIKVFVDPQGNLQASAPTLLKTGLSTNVYWLLESSGSHPLSFPPIQAGNPLVGVEFKAADGGNAEFGCQLQNPSTYLCTDQRGAPAPNAQGYKYKLTVKDASLPRPSLLYLDPYIINN